MKHSKFNDSETLREFGRIMSEKGITKTAQVAPTATLAEDEKEKLQHFLTSLQTAPSNGPGMKRWMDRLNGQQDPYLKAVHDTLAQRYQLWSLGKEGAEIATVPFPSAAPQMAQAPAAVHTSELKSNTKTAEEKKYDLAGNEDMVQEAHPKTALVNGDVVENIAEQQEADVQVAEKSAKEILKALYKLAGQLKADKQEEAFGYVKAAFLDIAKTLKK